MANNNLALPEGIVLHGEAYDYKITSVLGQGTFGITYRAKVEMRGALGTLDSNMYVAIKEFFMKEVNGRDNTSVTSGSTSRDGLFEYYREKFEREARNLSTLQHKNIVRVLESFQANGTVYYAMEYISGQSLDSVIIKAPHHCLDAATALGYTQQLGSALSFMHSKGMLHLDVKPANAMVKDDGTVVLIDFGLSKQYAANGEPESSTKVGAGTPGYAPLEQASYREGKGFPTMMDVYALGGTLYKMLTGQRPPEASEILNDGFPIGEMKQHGVPPQVAACVRKAMAPLKKDRYKTIDQLLNALAQCSLQGGSYDELNEATTIAEVDVIGVVKPQVTPQEQVIPQVTPKPQPTPQPKPQVSPKPKPKVVPVPSSPIDEEEKKSNKSKMVIGAVVAVAAIIAFNAVPRGGKAIGGKTVPDTIEAIETHEITDTIPFMCADYTNGWWMGTVNKDNQPAGKGVFYFRDDDKDGRSVYRGCIYRGAREDMGKATLTYKNGNYYEGTFSNNSFDKGTLWIFTDSLVYVGTFLNNDFYKGTLYRIIGDRKMGEKVGTYEDGKLVTYIKKKNINNE
ncbi:MAG: protein kinase [Prevotella sp.]|nr:protein kinase [Prevotella sp.]